MIYPDFDNFEVKNETGEWRKLFYFTLEECKLEDFQETCSKFQHDRDEFVTSNSFVCFNGKTKYNGSVYPQHILLLCKTKLETICISPTRWINSYTKYENQKDIHNELVKNGMNPDSTSWDLRKTFELMKDPRIKESDD